MFIDICFIVIPEMKNSKTMHLPLMMFYLISLYETPRRLCSELFTHHAMSSQLVAAPPPPLCLSSPKFSPLGFGPCYDIGIFNNITHDGTMRTVPCLILLNAQTRTEGGYGVNTSPLNHFLSSFGPVPIEGFHTTCVFLEEGTGVLISVHHKSSFLRVRRRGKQW